MDLISWITELNYLAEEIPPYSLPNLQLVQQLFKLRLAMPPGHHAKGMAPHQPSSSEQGAAAVGRTITPGSRTRQPWPFTSQPIR